MASNSTVNILRNVRNLVGEVAFNAALEALKAEPAGAPELTAVAEKRVKKEKKERKTDPAQTAKRQNLMASFQAYISKVRAEMPEGTAYAEVRTAAKAQWAALGDAEKAAWQEAHPYVPKEGGEPSDVESGAEDAAPAEKSVTVVTVPAPSKKGDVTVTAVKTTETEPKKARGRPKKVDAVEQKGDE